MVRVREAVEDAELRTSAEIVVSIAPFFFGNVSAAAHRAFARLGVANTRARNGVLVFLVPARRQVIVLADDGATARIDDGVWRDVASRIAAASARGEATAGLLDGIDQLARVLGEAFPRDPGDVNELPDQPHVGELS